MAFSFRKMLSNINYFKKTGESSDSIPEDEAMEISLRRRRNLSDESILQDFDFLNLDSTEKHTSLKLPQSVKNYAVKKGSLSDTDVLTRPADAPLRSKKRKCKKLKLDIKKANNSTNELSGDSADNVENTPKHVLLDCKSADLFSERFKEFHFNKSFELLDALSDELQSSPFDIDIESLSDDSDESAHSEFSLLSSKSSIKMCRKVLASQSTNEQQSVPSTSLESFGDLEINKNNEEERVRILESCKFKLAKMDESIKKFFHELQFHIEVSKVFLTKAVVKSESNGEIKHQQNNDLIDFNGCDGSESSSDSWNLVIEKEDSKTKTEIKNQLLSIKSNIQQFTSNYLKVSMENDKVKHHLDKYNQHMHKNLLKRPKSVNDKKKMKCFDFPDLREALLNLFTEDYRDMSLSDSDDSNMCQCMCKCHAPLTPTSQTDSGMLTKINDNSMSITSSIGNFSLDSSTLTAYSESLDQVVSYNSFQDSSLYSTLLQKSAIERITFYVQVHSIQLKCEEYDEFKSITFFCPSCKETLLDENSLLKHILSQYHCEKIHFVYKTAYIKKCVSSGKEIQPSTVLNSMTMYRDENKIVCFGDAMYACSLCFDNLIVGESVLMLHCYDPQHVERRSKLDEILD